MKYTIFLLEDRVPFLMKEMDEGHVEVLEIDDRGMARVEITIDDNIDLLKVFHAGVMAGSPKQKVD